MFEAVKETYERLDGERRAIVWVLGTLVIFLILTAIIPDLATRKTTRMLSTGKVTSVALTLVTADVADLACAGNDEVAGARCLYDASGLPRRALPFGEGAGKSDAVLAPYMTTDNVLFLIRGLWSEPAIAKRLAEEPPAGIGRDRLKRFTARCQLKIEGRANDVAVRWTPNAAFAPQGSAWAGAISGCKIE